VLNTDTFVKYTCMCKLEEQFSLTIATSLL